MSSKYILLEDVHRYRESRQTTPSAHKKRRRRAQYIVFFVNMNKNIAERSQNFRQKRLDNYSRQTFQSFLSYWSYWVTYSHPIEHRYKTPPKAAKTAPPLLQNSNRLLLKFFMRILQIYFPEFLPDVFLVLASGPSRIFFQSSFCGFFRFLHDFTSRYPIFAILSNFLDISKTSSRNVSGFFLSFLLGFLSRSSRECCQCIYRRNFRICTRAPSRICN